jgi:hypothetical protein
MFGGQTMTVKLTGANKTEKEGLFYKNVLLLTPEEFGRLLAIELHQRLELKKSEQLQLVLNL